MEVAVVRDGDGFDLLREEWDRLVAACPEASIFQTFDWQRTWWRHFGASHRLLLLLAREQQRLVAILPLYEAREAQPLAPSLRRVRPIGIGGETSPDYLGQIALPEYARAAAAAFCQQLVRDSDRWDVLELSDLREGSELLAEASRMRPSREARVVVGESARISYTDLPKTWDAYLAAMNSHARYAVRNVRRKFLAVPRTRLFVWTDRAGLDTAVDRLIQLHNMRWHGRVAHHSFSTQRYNAFHRELMHVFMEKDWLRLYCIQLGEEIIGIYYCYVFRGVLFHFQGGFDPKHENLRIGQCLMGYAVESAIGEGCTGLDMLRGEYDYKKRWAPSTRTTYSVSVTRPTLAANVDRLMRGVLVPIKSRLKRIVGRGSSRAPAAASARDQDM